MLGLNWAVATCRFLPVRPGQTRGCTEGRAGEGRDSGRRASHALGPSHLLLHTTCPSACSCRAPAPHRQCNDHASQVIAWALFLFLKHAKIICVLGISHWLFFLSGVSLQVFASTSGHVGLHPDVTTSKRSSLTALCRVTSHHCIISQSFIFFIVFITSFK